MLFTIKWVWLDAVCIKLKMDHNKSSLTVECLLMDTSLSGYLLSHIEALLLVDTSLKQALFLVLQEVRKLSRFIVTVISFINHLLDWLTLPGHKPSISTNSDRGLLERYQGS